LRLSGGTSPGHRMSHDQKTFGNRLLSQGISENIDFDHTVEQLKALADEPVSEN